MKRIGLVVATALVAVLGVGSGAAAAPTIGPFCKLGCIEPDPASSLARA